MSGPGVVAIAGVLAAGFTLVVVGRSDVLIDPQLSAWVRAAFVLANVAGGAYTWWRRPASGFGPLLASAGLLFALTSLNALAAPLPFTLGRVAYAVVMFALVYVCLCFPRGRLGIAPGPAVRRRPRGGAVGHLAARAGARGRTAGERAVRGLRRRAARRTRCRCSTGAPEAGRLLGDVANAVTVASFVAVTGPAARADARVRRRPSAARSRRCSSRWPRSSRHWRRTPSPGKSRTLARPSRAPPSR